MSYQISTTNHITTLVPVAREDGSTYLKAVFTRPDGTTYSRIPTGEPKPHVDCPNNGLMVWTWGPYSNDGSCTGCDIDIYSGIGD